MYILIYFEQIVEPSKIENTEAIIRHFGYWPSFHDSEIVSLHFERGSPGWWPVISLKLYAFEMTSELVGKYYKLVKHCLIDFEFHEVVDNEIDSFNHQNVLMSLSFAQDGKLIVCTIDPAHGVGGSITAQVVVVRNVLPIEGKPVHS